jgi:DNA-binding beta-propeller fold protein YncE
MGGHIMQTHESGRRSRLRFIASTVFVAMAVAACGKSKDSGAPPSAPAFEIKAAAHDAQFVSPFDATPDPDGKYVYFTAMTADGPAVFRSLAGGGELTRLFAGAPLVTPFAIAISDDGKTLFVADAGSESDTDEQGAILTLSAEGGTPVVLAGTTGTTPRGIEVNGDTVYFSGSKDGAPAVLSVPTAGGSATVILSGAPLRDPSGIAIAKSGALYVLDTSAAASRSASVLKIQSGNVDVVTSDIPVGFPGGVALNADESSLLVSALDPTNASDVVLVVNLASRETASFTATVDQFRESAGLHRARRAPVFAWADSQADGSGTVYVLQ